MCNSLARQAWACYLGVHQPRFRIEFPAAKPCLLTADNLDKPFRWRCSQGRLERYFSTLDRHGDQHCTNVRCAEMQIIPWSSAPKRADLHFSPPLCSWQPWEIPHAQKVWAGPSARTARFMRGRTCQMAAPIAFAHTVQR
jgi:hypothetical protein